MLQTMQNKKRIESIDLAKGIGILLVILGHLNVDGQYSRYVIFAFHMPLFFALSGVFAAGRAASFSAAVKKSVRTVYIPFLFMATGDFILRLVSELHKGNGLADSIRHYGKLLIGLELPFYNRALWFLFALFAIKILFLLTGLIKKATARNALIAVLTAGAFVFVLLRSYLDLPENLIYIMAIPGFAYFAMGYFLRERICRLEEEVKRSKVHLVLFVPAVIVLCGAAYFNGMVDMTVYNYSNPALYIVAAFAGCYAMMVFCAYLANSRLLRIKKVLLFYGKNSLVVLMTHYLFARKLYPPVYRHFGWDEVLYHPLNELFLLAVTALLMIPIIAVFNRLLYFVIGKKRQQR